MTIKKIIPLSGVTLTDLEDEGVLLSLETKNYYTLNKPGVYVWGLIGDGILSSEIVKRVQEEFSVDKKTAKKNVYEFIDELVKENLVQIVEE